MPSPNAQTSLQTPSTTEAQATMPTGQPCHWTSAMKTFLVNVLANGEDNKSALILLETEFPHMVGLISLAWVNRVRKGEV